MGMMKRISMTVGMRAVEHKPKMVQHAVEMAQITQRKAWYAYKRKLKRTCGYSAWQVLQITSWAHALREEFGIVVDPS